MQSNIKGIPMTIELSPSLETRIQELGRELLAEGRENKPRSFQDELLLTRLMNDESARTQALRFVDVLPALKADPDLVAHLQQYFEGHTLPVPAPGLAQWALDRSGKGIPALLMAKAVRAGARMLAERFIAGSDVPSVLPKLEALRKDGMGFTLDLLGETTLSETEALEFQQRYLVLLRELDGHINKWPLNPKSSQDRPESGPRLHLSIKLSGLYSQMDPVDIDNSVAILLDRLRPVMQAARKAKAFITVDMEHYNFKEITLRVFREILTEPEFADWPHVGIAMQAYLRDTYKDLEGLIAWVQKRGTPITVRLVRGAYWDYETLIAAQNDWPVPVWTTKEDTDRCYESCLALLMNNAAHLCTAIASHNVRSIALALALAEENKLTPGQYEFQMLYGMADHLKTTLVERGQHVRVYTPFGDLLPGMAYFVRRLLENTSSQSFVRMSGAEEQPDDQLLAAPDSAKVPDVSATAPVPGPNGALVNSQGRKPLEQGTKKTASPNGATVAHPPRKSGFRSEPLRRFTAPAERANFQQAIDHVRSQLGRDYPMVINNKPITTKDQIISTNPARNGQIVGRVASAGQADVHAAIAAAKAAQIEWANLPANERAEFLFRAADDMRSRRDLLSAWQVFEVGKPWREADGDVVEAIDFLNYYGHEMLRLSAGVGMNRPGETNHYQYEPRGVVAVISPWNFPLAILTGMVAAAVVAGNTVVMKPAPQSPITGYFLMDTFMRIGLPPGVVNFLPGGDEAGAELVKHPDIAVIAFTGSQSVGCKINEVAAHVPPGQDHLKRVIAELGGKNAIIVDSSADLDDAVAGTVASAFGYAGQKCSAASRVIVLEEIYDVFLKRVIEAADSIRLGLPEDPGTLVGPVIDPAARDRIAAAIAAGKSQARCALTRDISTFTGSYIGPTIFADVDPASPLAQDEFFGPVLAVIKARDFSHALQIANGTRYALTGGLFSRSPANLARARREFRVGNLYLNRRITGAVVGHQPFGGMKMSGVGSKAGGPDYLLQFMEPKTITENTLRRGFAPTEESK
jgi:RHH-type transcriptional regulator, proline utilization regulon repressor / proline dehydrogenase / delta 1-pyrroline-5-carboxylate dehydrogenase